ncbi:MAG: tyrosine-type recombinase/integrase, partial [Burkholderiales bacterium]
MEDYLHPIRQDGSPGCDTRRAQVDAGLHALRHFYASALIRHGENVKTVQRRMGHSSSATTLDTYTHLWPDFDDRTRQAVGARCQLLRALCGQQRDHRDVFAGQISEDGSTCGSSTTASS